MKFLYVKLLNYFLSDRLVIVVYNILVSQDSFLLSYEPFTFWIPVNRHFGKHFEDPDEMQHELAFHQGLHCLLR